MGKAYSSCVKDPGCCKRCNMEPEYINGSATKQQLDPNHLAPTQSEDEKCGSFSAFPGSRQIRRTDIHVDSRRHSMAVKEAKGARITERPKTQADRKLISVCLSRHFIFSNLSEETRDAISNQMKFYELGPREDVFLQDQPATNFFILATGRLEELFNGTQKRLIKPAEGFGELALLHDAKRTATIRTLEKSTLWGMDRDTFRQYVLTVNTQNYEVNKQFFSSIRIFQPLTDVQKENLLTVVNTHKFRENHCIVHEGDPGEILYVIKEGTVLCSSKGVELRRMSKGEFFGELALLQGGTRTATVTAVDGDVTCLSIGREDLRKVLGNHLKQIIYINALKIAIDRSLYLRLLTKEQKSKLITEMRVDSYHAGHVIASANTLIGTKLWIVVNGLLRYTGADITAEVYTCIGDDAMSKPIGGPYGSDIACATEDADVAEVSREKFEECIGGQLMEATANNGAWKLLQQVQLLKGLSQKNLTILMQALRISEFQDGSEIVRQNKLGDSLFIIKAGKVDVFKDGIYIRTITKLDYFGERSVLFNDFRSATVIANGQVSCWVLAKEDFLNITDESVQVRMMKRIDLQNDRIRLNELTIIGSLSRNGYGNLFIVKRNDSETLYALKSVNRKSIRKWGLEDNLNLERMIGLQLDSSFIVKLVKTFKDNQRLYFLLEYVNGIDMFDLLKKNALSDADAKFYIGCVIIILEHLHERQIIHRDVNPENLLIDDEGYVKLIDFSKAKIVPSRTYTIVGSPHYMAPEMITGKGYNHAADLWSTGVVLYEFFCGGVPFGEEEEDPIIIYEKILESRLVYPSFIDSTFPARPLIEQLLNKSPAMRLAGSFENLKAHSWFENFDWVFSTQNKLAAREMRAPYIPQPEESIKPTGRRRLSFNSIIVEEENHEDEDGVVVSSSHIPPLNWDSQF